MLNYSNGICESNNEPNNIGLYINFIKSVKNRNIEDAKKYISSGVDINARDILGNPAIFYAIDNNDLDMIKLFLNNNVNLEESNNGMSTIEIAILKHRYDILNLFINHIQNKRHIILHILETLDTQNNFDSSSSIDCANIVLEKYVTIANNEEDLKNIFSYAMKINNQFIMHKILEKFVNDEKYSKDIFLYAVKSNNQDIVNKLLKKGIDINNFEDDLHENALITASKYNNSNMIIYLINNGINIENVYEKVIEINRALHNSHILDILNSYKKTSKSMEPISHQSQNLSQNIILEKAKDNKYISDEDISQSSQNNALKDNQIPITDNSTINSTNTGSQNIGQIVTSDDTSKKTSESIETVSHQENSTHQNVISEKETDNGEHLFNDETVKLSQKNISNDLPITINDNNTVNISDTESKNTDQNINSDSSRSKELSLDLSDTSNKEISTTQNVVSEKSIENEKHNSQEKTSLSSQENTSEETQVSSIDSSSETVAEDVQTLPKSTKPDPSFQNRPATPPSTVTSTQAQEQVSPQQPSLEGTWRGQLTTAYGKTGATLIVKETQGKPSCVFTFYPLKENPSAGSGQYEMSVNYDEASMEYTLRGVRWIKNPKRRAFMHLRGKQDGSVFSGTVFADIPTQAWAFSLEKTLP